MEEENFSNLPEQNSTQEPAINVNEQLQQNVQSADAGSPINNDQSSKEFVLVTSAKNKKIGLRLLIGPFVGVIIALVGVAIVQAIKSLSGTSTGSIAAIALSFANWIFIVIGVLSIIGFVIGIPAGIIYLCKREMADGAKYDERSGNKNASIVPEEIKGWNWGAAGLTWIWGIGNNVWISLLAFIPLVNIAMWIVLGLKGNELAWKAQKWESPQEFINYQNKWKPWGMIFLALSMLSILSRILGAK